MPDVAGLQQFAVLVLGTGAAAGRGGHTHRSSGPVWSQVRMEEETTRLLVGSQATLGKAVHDRKVLEIHNRFPFPVPYRRYHRRQGYWQFSRGYWQTE
jgi:hypothetical protein